LIGPQYYCQKILVKTGRDTFNEGNLHFRLSIYFFLIYGPSSVGYSLGGALILGEIKWQKKYQI